MAEPKASVVVTFQNNGIAVVRMQRGENRINPDFLQAFHGCLDQIENDTSCKGVVTTGEGKFYSNGLDLAWLATQDSDALRTFIPAVNHLLKRILTFPLPTAAAINAADNFTIRASRIRALIALAQDLRVMNSQRGWLCFNEIFMNKRLNTILSIKYLYAKVESKKTLHRALVFGQRFTGPEAVSSGMIDSCVAPPLVMSESQRQLLSWIPKEGFLRESMENMKLDFFADAIKEEHQSKL